MADITVTAANVQVGSSATQTTGVVQFGETMTAGQSSYLKISDGKWWKLDANLTTLATDTQTGIVLTGASADGYGVIVTKGPIIIGATVAVGMNYIASTTAGGIAPVSDFSGYSTVQEFSLGHATTTGIINVNPSIPNAQIA